MEVVINYGYNMVECLSDFKKKCIKELENLTAMNIDAMEIVVKGIEV